MQKNRIDIITLGCSKNLVDSEKLIKQFKEIGYDVYHDSDNVKGEIVIINTCGFIGDAKEESINMILNFCQAKKARKIKRLYVMGCLSQRYASELIEEIPEVDGFFGKFDWENIVKEVGGEYNQALANSRVLTTPSHYAYLKIGEGCNRTCAYCAIPIITGKYKSRTIEDLVEEAQGLAAMGVKELQLIAQDLTYYGLDIYKSYQLPKLVEELSKVEGIEWIRLHYAYPAHFPYELLPVMAQNNKVCKYLDIALQHISDNMLTRMHRNVTKQQTYQLIERIRKEVPGIHLRTTLMVGFPGETEEDFAELMEFVKYARFERMGAFTYSEEEGTYSAENYTDDIPEEVKQKRLDTLMALQAEISAEINAQKEGEELRVIIDREEEDYYIGRTQFDSPEVDPEVLISKDKTLNIGEFYTVKITSSSNYELFGSVK
ncbi:MAG: 30S ribosomal protein S12 methylthiotransferase RimO [Bacteroidaceae bacterium]|nr:30S ribosomal protein S12 methylthiotransferase RimO [Bacteroidaceae bacterium]